MKAELIKFLKKELGNKLDYDKLIEKPKLETQGDFALPMFLLSKEEKKNPVELAKEIQEKLLPKLPSQFTNIVAVGPFLNFFLDNTKESEKILKAINSKELITKNQNQKVMIEYPSPNTNKPLHLGHVRNMLLGKSISNILEAKGNKICSASINNDRGIAICKSMLAYLKFGNKNTPQKANIKPDHFVGNYYVEFDKQAKINESLNQEAQDMLVKWEEGEKSILMLWKMMRDWALEGYKETYDNYGVKIDYEYSEADIYKLGRDIVMKGLKEGIFEKEEDGSVIINLEDIGMDKKILLRSDGTSVYLTQDLALTGIKKKDFDYDMCIYVVGNEQNYHFKVLFEIFERMKLGEKKENHHLAYGMVNLPEGKMKSREGTVVDADDLLSEVTLLSKESLEKRNPELDSKELEKRSKVIAMAAVSFFILKVNPSSDMVYNPKESLSFEGETGPYVLYTYARIKSVLRKAKNKVNDKINYSLFTDKEVSMIKTLNEFEEVVEEAAKKYKPSQIANYLLKLSQQYNEFYHSSQILKEKDELKEARLLLSQSVSIVLKKGLELLGIETLETM